MPDLSRRDFLRLGTASAALAAGGRALGQNRPPNLVFILADDLGWRDTSPYNPGTVYETPNLARLAARSLRFTQAYAANPLCSPTRSSVLTGLYPARIGITTPVGHVPEEILAEVVQEKAGPERKLLEPVSATRLKLEYTTLAEVLHSAGYRCGHFGKWHLGAEPYDPLHQGFDVDLPHTSGPGPAGSYVAPWKFPEKLHFTGEPGEHLEDRMASDAVAFVKENRERPFYLNYWAFSVHSPWGGKPELIEYYRRKIAAHPESLQRHPVYAAMVHSLDQNIGRLLDCLDEQNLTGNTIVVFFSDNGGVHWVNEPDGYGVPITSNAPLRGGKATIYEGGTREPCLVSWPGRTRAGGVTDAMLSSVDWLPTVLQMLALKPPEGVKLDGVSQVPALLGQGQPRDTVYCFFPHTMGPNIGTVPSAYVHRGDWKLIRCFHDGPDKAHRYELYNLRDDLGETSNLAEREPGRVKELDALLEAWLTEVGAVRPVPNPAYDPNTVLLEGWRLIRNLTMSIKDGILVLEASGGLATIATFQVPAAKGEVTLEVRMKSTASGPVNAFWGLPGEGSFKAERAVPMAFPHDGEWHETAAKLPCPGTLGGLRFDPANAPGHIEIDWIRLRDAEGKQLRVWEFAR
ncbi:MAG: sulfatase [Armatimonadetes bacterium]|nr:sulfatase [Armatimonadota bacterium]